MSGPLAGLRLIDVTIGQQGPAATMMLADMGAEVIKIESRRGDPGRGIELQPDGTSPFFLAHNRGKKSVAVNLRRPEGREVVLRLAARSDVFVEAWVPGVMERLGLDYESVRQRNPRIIYASGTSFGPKGPRAALPSMDMVAQGVGGLMMANAGPRGTTPVPVGPTIADQTGAFLLAYGIVLALYHRERTGQGQRVDVSLLAGQVALQGWHIAHFSRTGALTTGADRRQRSPLFNYYRASDGWFTIAIIDEQHWPVLCRIAGREDLAADPRFADRASRNAHRAALIELLDAAFAARPRDGWLAALEAEQIPCGPVNTYGNLLRDPQVLANEYLVSQPHPSGGEIKLPGLAVGLSQSPGRPGPPAPELGQHTEEVLLSLGYSWEEIGRLREERVIL